MTKSVVFVSTALPPSASGQAKVLERLIRNTTDKAFWFLSDNPSTFTQSPGDGFGHYIRLAERNFAWTRSDLPPALASIRKRIDKLKPVRDRAREIHGILLGVSPRVIVGCSGNPFDLAAAALAAQELKVPYVAYLFDDPIYQWPEGPHRAFARHLEPLWSQMAASTIVPNEVLAAEFKKRSGRDAFIVRNPLDGDEVFQGLASTSSVAAMRTPVRLAYTGSVYHAQGDAFANLTAAMALTPGRYRLDVYTSQSQSALVENGLSGPDLVRHDHVGDREVAQVQHNADILFLPLAFRSTIQEVLMSSSPGKLAEYLSSGRPILVHAPAGSFVSEFFRRTGAGYVVDRPSIQELAQGLNNLATDPELCARLTGAARTAAHDFSCRTSRERFWQLIDGVAGLAS
jgi:glycosyltransferase involved in cell wall biosynthesis